MKNQSEFREGQWVVDKEGNEFKIMSIIPHNDPLIDAAVTLKSAFGEIEIGSIDLAKRFELRKDF